jgi:hypothetical protein
VVDFTQKPGLTPLRCDVRKNDIVQAPVCESLRRIHGDGRIVLRDRRGTSRAQIPDTETTGTSVDSGDPVAIYKPIGVATIDLAKAMAQFTETPAGRVWNSSKRQPSRTESLPPEKSSERPSLPRIVAIHHVVTLRGSLPGSLAVKPLTPLEKSLDTPEPSTCRPFNTAVSRRSSSVAIAGARGMARVCTGNAFEAAKEVADGDSRSSGRAAMLNAGCTSGGKDGCRS